MEMRTILTSVMNRGGGAINGRVIFVAVFFNLRLWQYLSVAGQDIFESVNPALRSASAKEPRNICRVLRLGEQGDGKYMITKGETSYQLRVGKLELHIYAFGCGVLFLYAENWKYPDIQDIQRIADYGRRIALPFLPCDNPSLKYRMRIYCPEPPQIVSVNNGSAKGADGRPVKLQDYSYSLFYGNSGKATPDKQTLSNPALEIQCLKAELRKLIEESVTEFFLTTNFGTMQSKGFGSFAPAEFCRDYWLNDDQRAEIAGYLKRKTGLGICYCMTFDPPYYDEKG